VWPREVGRWPDRGERQYSRVGCAAASGPAGTVGARLRAMPSVTWRERGSGASTAPLTSILSPEGRGGEGKKRAA